MRRLEVAANEAFDVYRELYYEGGVGSVYFWDLDDGFAGVILLKKGTFKCNGLLHYGGDSLRVYDAPVLTIYTYEQGYLQAASTPASGTASTSSKRPIEHARPTTN